MTDNQNDGSNTQIQPQTVVQPAQTPTNIDLPPARPESREIKQDVGVDERNIFEKEEKKADQ